MNPETPVAPVPALRQTPEQLEKLRQIAQAQGKQGKSTFENLLGSGAELWETDEEFESFLEQVEAIRHAKG
jgi:hypothetical protein